MDLADLDSVLQTLTPHQSKIIQVLYDSGNTWLTRSKVAKALGKRRLTPYDINCLTNLAEDGIIECATQPSNAPGSDFAYIYHISDEMAEALQVWVEKREKAEKKVSRKPIKLSDSL